ncbi:MAG: lysophospholipase [Candidatus Omnitrophica bacterium]|nr:lysophospholipase [Candidatus Omnitrophota bacterium]
MCKIARDKETGIKYRFWEAVFPDAVCLFVHGLGAHAGRWKFIGEFLKNNNVSSYALELKGFGEDTGLKGHIDSFDLYFEDVHKLYDTIRLKYPRKKVFLIGESMGAIISLMFTILNPDLFNGLVCVSPAFVSRVKFSLGEYLDIFSSYLYRPRKQFKMPFTSEMCTRDKVYQEEMNEDKREHRMATSKLLVQTVIAQIKVMMMKGRIEIPVLFLLAGQDKLVDSAVSEKVFEGLKTKDKKIDVYPEMYHALSIELDKERVFDDILVWIKERL